MTAAFINKALRRHFHEAWMHLQNSYVLGWEADYLCWMDKKYWCEVEIKVTRSDFKRDFSHKPLKHEALAKAHQYKRGWWVRRYQEYEYLNFEYEQYRNVPTKDWPRGMVTPIAYQHVPHRFYFACPEGLIQRDELPKYYGLIWILPNGKTKLVRRPCTLHQAELPIMRDVAIKQHFVIDKLLRKLEELTFNQPNNEDLHLLG